MGAVSEGKGQCWVGWKGTRRGAAPDRRAGARAAAGRVAMATGALARLRMRRPGRHFGGCRERVPSARSLGVPARRPGSRSLSGWCDRRRGPGLAHPLVCGRLRAREYRPEARVCFPPVAFNASSPSRPDSEAPEMDLTGNVTSSDTERIPHLNRPKLSRKRLLCYI